MSQDVSVNPMIAVIDVVQNAVDYGQLTDYLKTSFKKEVLFLNAQDFTDAGSRVTKTENKSSTKSKSTSGGLTSSNSYYEKKNMINDPQTQAIVKGIKAKIDADLVKVLDAKKKTYASFEKEKLKALSKSAKNSSNEEKANSLKSKATIDFDELKMSLPFEGKIDILYLIVNFPYLPRQLARLIEGGVDLNVFLTIVPKDFEESSNNMDSQRSSANVNSEIENIQKNEKIPISIQGNKKSVILGQELDSLQNPNMYPPLRWMSIRETAPTHVVFEKVFAGDSVESTFKNIEEKLILITKARESYNEYFKEKSIIELPIVNPNHNDNQMNNFIEFLAERQGDFINALYYELKSHDFHTIRPPPPPPIADQFASIFNEAMNTLERRVVFLEPRELNISDFSFEYPPLIHSLIYKLINWSVKKEDAGACQALSSFLNSPQNFYAYAGSKFDSIVQSMNKKHQLSLPLSFFDWSQWNYAAEYLQLGEALVDGIRNSDIIETSFDRSIGILWVLAIQPVPKTIGQFQSRYFMPQTIEGISEYIDNLFDSSDRADGGSKTAPPEKKSRNSPSPAQIIKDALDMSILLPNLQQRMNENDSYYRMPIKVSNSINFNAPYYFDSGLKVNIKREVVNEKMTFNYTANFKQFFDVFANKRSVTVQTFEGIRVMFEKPFAVTILFNEQSIRYNSESITIKSTGEFPIMITKNGAFIMNDKDGVKTIVHPNGTITRNVQIEVEENNEKPPTSEAPSARHDHKLSTRSLSGSLTTALNNLTNTTGKEMMWRSIDKDGNSYLHSPDGKMTKEDLKHGETVDLSTMMRNMIRPDNIEYYIKKDGTRKIIFGLDFSIEQSFSNPLDEAFGENSFESKSLKEGNKLNKGGNKMENIKNLDNFNVDLLEELKENIFIFDIPNFPVIQMKGNELTMTLDRFLFNFCDENVKMTCPDYSININTENVSVSAPPPSEETEAVAISASLSLSISKMNNISNSVSRDSNNFPKIEVQDHITMMCLTQQRCEFRCNEKVLVADQNGIEKMYQLLSEEEIEKAQQNENSKRKKVDLSIMTQWGKANPIKDSIVEQQQIDFYKLFNPHFYAIRADMTMCEFLRKDSIKEDDCVVFEEVLSHPTCCECNIKTYHHPIRPPAVYFINKPLTKPERSTILKGLHIPKPKKEKPKNNNKKPVQSSVVPGTSSTAPSPPISASNSTLLTELDENNAAQKTTKNHSKKSSKSKSKNSANEINNQEATNETTTTEQRKTKSRSKSRANANSPPEVVERPLQEESSNIKDIAVEIVDDDDDDEDDEAVQLAEANHNVFFCESKLFVKKMNNWLEEHNIAYEQMMKQPEPQPPEILQVPPQTPSPRILEAQASKYSKTVSEFQSGAVAPNYWESFEAEFAMPLNEPRTVERDLSPRTKLCDPPRPFREKKRSYYYRNDAQFTSDEDQNLDFYDEDTYNNLDSNYVPKSSDSSRHSYNFDNYNNNTNNSNITKAETTKKKIIYKNKIVSCSVGPNTNRNSLNSIITRPVTVKATPNAINFGQIKINTSASAQLVITNTGKVPLHYSVTQTSEPNIKVLTIPGVVFPGLKMTLKVALLPSRYPQNITTSFQLKTQMFDLSIPVTVDIVDE